MILFGLSVEVGMLRRRPQVAKRSATTAGQKTILAALKLPEPPRFFDFTVPSD